MKLTAGVASIKIGSAGIEFEVGKNRLNIDLISIAEISAVKKTQADLLKQIKDINEKHETLALAVNNKGVEATN
mgnify:CR=1 FL=1